MTFSSIKSALIDFRIEKLDSDYDEETWSYLTEVLKGDDIDFDEKHDWLCGMFPLMNDMNSKEIVKCLIGISKGICMKSPENCVIFSNPKVINGQNDLIVSDDLNDGGYNDNDDDNDQATRSNSMRSNDRNYPVKKDYSIKTPNEKILDDYIFKFQDCLSKFAVDRSTVDDAIIQYLLELIVDIERLDEVALIIQPYFPYVSEDLFTELAEHVMNLSNKYTEEKLNCNSSIITPSNLDGFETQSIECVNSSSSLENDDHRVRLLNDNETNKEKEGVTLFEEILSEYPVQVLEDFQLLGSMLPDVPKDVLLFVYLIEHQRDKNNAIQFFLDVNEKDRERIYDDIKNRFNIFIERFV